MRTTKQMQQVANFVTDADLAATYGIGSGAAKPYKAEEWPILYGIGTRDVPAAIQTELASLAIQIGDFGASDPARPAAFAMTVGATDAQITTLRAFLAEL